jgi:hypothetical protein
MAALKAARGKPPSRRPVKNIKSLPGKRQLYTELVAQLRSR